MLRHETGLATLTKEIDLAWCTTENIKKNVIGKLLEDEPPLWMTKKTRDDPANNTERFYHAATKDLIANEIFRRVEPKKRTMNEYLADEFPDL